MHFSQSQLTTIALAGMVGQYPFAAFVGKVLDRHGPRICSLAASLLFALGFGLFSIEISRAPDDVPSPSTLAFCKLTISFTFVGLATVFSYFSIVFSATNTFPTYTGIASGTTMALFGSSPLVLAALAAYLFTDSSIGLNVSSFLAFLAVITGVTHLFGAVFLPGPVAHTLQSDEYDAHHRDDESHATQSVLTINDEEAVQDEHSPLISHRPHLPPDSFSGNSEPDTAESGRSSTNKASMHARVVLVREPQHGPVWALARDPYWWVLVIVVMILVGECEMIMANLGSLFLSLAAHILSVDFLECVTSNSAPSPTAVTIPHPEPVDPGEPMVARPHRTVWAFPRHQHLSRTLFLVGAAVILAITFGWALGNMRTQGDVWILCIGVGIVYGAVFTVLAFIIHLRPAKPGT
ncbi:hypothetical protein NM688_g5958 [Phlebia brevispora]|uniref:Uncharacterized protein n=1 Tax=Phlebia brevispora TaxID=194682 RepID=A0ACC1SM37_9APHY|nr:hypothetical protein NM688_g5958 [Phlebia brevispora]